MLNHKANKTNSKACIWWQCAWHFIV